MWQEECWSTAGVRNLVGTSMEGGQTWRNIRLQGVGIVAGGEFQNKNAGPLLRRPLDGRRSDPGTGLVPRGPKPVGVPGIRSGDGVPNATVAPAERDDLCGLAGLSVLQGEARRRPPHPLHRQGRTWSAPIKVNDTPTGAQAAFLPTVKVDANGRVGVVYYDLRNDTNPRDGSFLTTEWITFSTDGGRTFGPGERGRARLRPRRRGLRPRLLPGRLPGAWRQRSHVHAIFRRRAREQAHGQVGSDIFAATAD